MVASTSGRSNVGRWNEWLALITVILAAIGMSLSSPPMAGPDESTHQATASHLTVYITPPITDAEDYIGGIAKFGSCMAFDPAKDASCSPNRDDVWPAKMRVVNYPPLYYWVVGLGQKFAPEADTWMDVGGRVASLLLNLAGLVLLAWLTMRRSRIWGSSILAVATPMAVFLWGVVNPNGWEITAGLLFAFFFARSWWAEDDSGPERGSRWSVLVPLGLSSVAFALARPAAFLWLGLLVVAILLMGRTHVDRPRQLATLAIAGLGVVAGVLWQLTHPSQTPVNNPNPVANPGPLDYLHWLGQIDEALPDRLRQMVGVLGALDTPVPQWMVLVLLLSWGALIGFLYARTTIPPLALVLGFVATTLVPSALETLQWNDWPYLWQGRYTLPFTIPFLFVLLMRFGRFGERAVVLLSIVTGGVLTVMVWQNFARYAFGITDYLPLRLDNPAIDGVWLWGTFSVLAALIVITVVRAVIFARGPRRAVETGDVASATT